MNLYNFIIKSQEAIQKAQEIAVGNQHQAIESIHLIKGTINVDENLVPYLLQKLDINIGILSKVIYKSLEQNQTNLNISDEALKYIARAGFDLHFGARPVKRKIQKSILKDLSKMIISEELNKNSEIFINLKNNKLVFSNSG